MAAIAKVVFNGKTYYLYPGEKYYSRGRAVRGGVTRLHREVWEFYRGPIPAGHHVHHQPGASMATIDIGDLECLTAAAHRRFHAEHYVTTPAQLAHLENIRPLTKAWHSSPEGREKHREIGALAYAGFTPTPKPCEQCGQEFDPRKIGNLDRFCSNACKSAFRRASGVDNETRVCVECGESFVANRYSKKRSCSRSCTGRRRHREKVFGFRPSD